MFFDKRGQYIKKIKDKMECSNRKLIYGSEFHKNIYGSEFLEYETDKFIEILIKNYSIIKPSLDRGDTIEQFMELYENNKGLVKEYQNRVKTFIESLSGKVFDNRQWTNCRVDDPEAKSWNMYIANPHFRLVIFDDTQYINFSVKISTQQFYKDARLLADQNYEEIGYNIRLDFKQKQIYVSQLYVEHQGYNWHSNINLDSTNAKISITNESLKKVAVPLAKEIERDNFNFYVNNTLAQKRKIKGQDGIDIKTLPQTFQNVFNELSKQIYYNRQLLKEYTQEELDSDEMGVDTVPKDKMGLYFPKKTGYNDLGLGFLRKEKSIGDTDFYTINITQKMKDTNYPLEQVKLLISCNNKTNECIFYPTTTIKSSFGLILHIDDIQTPKIKYIIEQMNNKFNMTEEKIKSIRNLIDGQKEELKDVPENVKLKYYKIRNLLTDRHLAISKPNLYNGNWDISVWYKTDKDGNNKADILKYSIKPDDSKSFTFTRAESIKPFKSADGYFNMPIRNEDDLKKIPDIFHNIYTSMIKDDLSKDDNISHDDKGDDENVIEI